MLETVCCSKYIFLKKAQWYGNIAEKIKKYFSFK